MFFGSKLCAFFLPSFLSSSLAPLRAYLNGTRCHSLTEFSAGKGFEVSAFVDSDHAKSDDRHSVSGGAVMVGD